MTEKLTIVDPEFVRLFDKLKGMIFNGGKTYNHDHRRDLENMVSLVEAELKKCDRVDGVIMIGREAPPVHIKQQGRPKTTGRFETREELVRRVLDFYRNTDMSIAAIARNCKVSMTTADSIIENKE